MVRLVLSLFLIIFLIVPVSAGWVYSGTPSWYYWQNTDGSYDGWNYLRSYTYGGYQYVQHSRYAAKSDYGSSLTAYSWRDRVVEILAKRNERYARMQEAAVDHAAFLETAQALQLAPPELSVSLPGGAYGAYGALEKGQQTLYGSVTQPLADAFRNYDLEARAAKSERLSEQAMAGALQINSDTKQTVREINRAYEHLKGVEIRKHAVEDHLLRLRELLNDAKPNEASGGRQPPEGPVDGASDQGADAPRSPITVPAQAEVVASKCVTCHGPTRAEKGLRLDFPDVLVRRRADIEDRIFRKDAKVMPPPDKQNPLTPLEKAAFAIGK